MNQRPGQLDNAVARDKAPELPGKPSQPVSRLSGYWGEAQTEKLRHFIELLPVIESVASVVPIPDFKELEEDEEPLTEEQRAEAMMNQKLTNLLKAKHIVEERLRKELR